MKHISQLVSSSFLLFVGFAVAALSLRGMHADAIYAAGTEINRPSEYSSGLDVSAFVDADMPGSVPYIMERGWERAQTLWLTDDEERLQEFILRVSQRQASAEEAWKAGKEELALTTYLKAFGYLHTVVHECFANDSSVDCSAWSESIALAASNLESSVDFQAAGTNNDPARAQAEGLVSQIHALRQQFLE